MKTQKKYTEEKLDKIFVIPPTVLSINWRVLPDRNTYVCAKHTAFSFKWNQTQGGRVYLEAVPPGFKCQRRPLKAVYLEQVTISLSISVFSLVQ